MRWAPGDVIAERAIYKGEVIFAVPEIVAADDGAHIALYLPAGADYLGGPVDFEAGKIGPIGPKTWRVTNALKLFEPDSWRAIWLMWRADNWQHLAWYVCLQEPYRRSRFGVDTRDLQLDLVVSPDLSNIAWKDRDHFARAQELGWITPDEAAAVEDCAARTVREIETRSGPFAKNWADWRPDSSWLTPSLPADWDRV
jgi:hypothetical protein